MKRRNFIEVICATTLGAGARVANSASALPLTRRQAEGPFYPVDDIPLTSNLVMDDNYAGETLSLSGRVFSVAGDPQVNVRIEIWQCDAKGIYRHPRDANSSRVDSAFRGFGAVLTDSRGHYAFKTILPVPYTGRPPHIHVKIWPRDTSSDGSASTQSTLTTQLYLHGRGGSERLQVDPVIEAPSSYRARFDFVIPTIDT